MSALLSQDKIFAQTTWFDTNYCQFIEFRSTAN